ncbi:MAG TPA: hypothetical protein VEY87_09595 [Gaiellaceae bacterium]|nr:hypothetical protein [Gaiellaceae bacterium]
MTRILLICLLAASAGVHLALAGGHGISFHVAAALLGLMAAALALRPGRVPAAAAALLLGGLLAAYVASGESLDVVAGVTKAIEAAGLLLAVRLMRRAPAGRPERVLVLVVAVMVAVFAAAVTPSGSHAHAPGTPQHDH